MSPCEATHFEAHSRRVTHGRFPRTASPSASCPGYEFSMALFVAFVCVPVLLAQPATRSLPKRAK